MHVVNYYGCAWAQLMLCKFCASFPFPAAGKSKAKGTSEREREKAIENMWKHMHNGKRAESQNYMPKDNGRIYVCVCGCGWGVWVWQTAVRLF